MIVSSGRRLLFSIESVSRIVSKMAMTTYTCDDPTAIKKMRLEEERLLRVKRLSEDATIPTKGSPQAAGYDLYRWAGLIQ